MHSHLASRLRKSSLSTVPPPPSSAEYSNSLASLAARILYQSPSATPGKLPVFVLNGAAFPGVKDVDYDDLLPYVLARLPREEELIGGSGYEVVFFAGGRVDGDTAPKKGRPRLGWYLQAYNVVCPMLRILRFWLWPWPSCRYLAKDDVSTKLSRATRKRLQKLYIVHTKTWVRILAEMFSTIVSPKSRRKILYCSTLTGLALHMPIEDILIPPSAYQYDRKVSPDIHSPYATGKRAFGASIPAPISANGEWRLPRVLRETTSFVLAGDNVKTEGIFRISPQTNLLDVLCEAYDRGQKYILWKQDKEMALWPAELSRIGQRLEEDIEEQEGYGVLMASAVIKKWYARLRKPLFPHTSYQQLKNLFPQQDLDVDLRQLVDLISVKSQWSVLPVSSRWILTHHLLPLLSLVSAQEGYNKMSPYNLAVCFAPSFLCGPDPIEDAKTCTLIIRITEAAIKLWDKGLRDALETRPEDFEQMLKAPPAEQDYEDPLDQRVKEPTVLPSSVESIAGQSAGIIMEDSDSTPLLTTDERPPLPARPSSSVTCEPTEPEPEPEPETALKRKPAPQAAVPPRYSVAIRGGVVTESSVPSASTESRGIVETKSSSSEKSLSTENEGLDSLARSADKFLTMQQMDEKPSTTSSAEGHRAPSLPLREQTPAQRQEPAKRKLVSPAPILPLGNDGPPPVLSTSPSKTSASGNDLRPLFPKPEWAASSHTLPTDGSMPPPKRSASASSSSAPFSSTKKVPTILNLAKPIQPAPSSLHTGPSPTPHTNLPLPSPTFPRLRTPSPSLSQRFPVPSSTAGPPQRAMSDSLDFRGRRGLPKRLDLGEESVRDLKRLYEERAGVVGALAGAKRR